MSKKATVTISIDVEDLADLDQVEHLVRAFRGSWTSEPVPGHNGEAYAAEPEAAEEAPPKEPTTAKKAAKKKRTRRTKTADADPVDVDLALSGDEAEQVGTDATPEDLQAAVKGAIEGGGIEKVRAVFGSYKNAAGKPCAKMSDVKAADYPAVIAALEA